MGNQTLLELKDLSVSFSGFCAVSNVNLKVKQGKIHVIIGPNGAGKSTLMDLITGKTKPTSGNVVYNGHDITGKEPGDIASKYKIGRKFQGPNVFDNMTVYENIEIALKGYTSIHKAFFLFFRISLFSRCSKAVFYGFYIIFSIFILFHLHTIPSCLLFF